MVLETKPPQNWPTNQNIKSAIFWIYLYIKIIPILSMRFLQSNLEGILDFHFQILFLKSQW
jgi:hypothetical protein